LERAGCRGVLLKPLDRDQFLALVSEALAAAAPAGGDPRIAL
jgi:hypothetical protein